MNLKLVASKQQYHFINVFENEYFCTGDIDTRFIRNHFSKYVQPMTPAQLKASKTAKTEKKLLML